VCDAKAAIARRSNASGPLAIAGCRVRVLDECGLAFLCGSFRPGLAHFLDQGVSLPTSGGCTFSRLFCEFAQYCGSTPQFFNDVDRRESFVVVALVRRHDAVILLDGRRDRVVGSARNLGPLVGVDVLQENPPSRRHKSFCFSDRGGTVAKVLYVLGLTVKLLLPILENRPDRIDGERLGRLQN
jgi:hypothetical protein